MDIGSIIEKLPMTKSLEIIIYFILVSFVLVFIYNNIVKDMLEKFKSNKNKKTEEELEKEISYCEDDYLLNHNFFKMMYRYIKVDLEKIFDINDKKGAQFLLLGKCKFISFHDFLKDLVEQTLEGKITFKGKEIDLIKFNQMLDMQQDAIDNYGKVFKSNGGNEYILTKFNEYHSKRVSAVSSMFSVLSDQDFFNKDNRNIVMGMLNIYTYVFMQTFEDLKEDYKKINGKIEEEMQAFDLTPAFKQRVLNLDVTKK